VRVHDGVLTAAPASPVATEVINFDDLKAVATLGKGSFGHVQLVQHRKSGATYALKAVNKAQIVATGQQGSVDSEAAAASACAPACLRSCIDATHRARNV